MAPVHILCVCTANICRSPATESLLRRGLETVLPDAVITSAGTAAMNGSPACEVSEVLVGEYLAAHYRPGPLYQDPAGHASRQVTRADLQRADLVIALDRSHRGGLAQIYPASRPRTFTLRQAAGAARGLTDGLRAGELPEGAPDIPNGAGERFAWLVAELDASRYTVSAEDVAGPGSLIVNQLDVPDPHVVGYEHHPLAVELIKGAVAELLESVVVMMQFGGTGSR